jgi:hypothetical protein
VPATLDKYQLTNDTLVIFSSDHGHATYTGLPELKKHGHEPNGSRGGGKECSAVRARQAAVARRGRGRLVGSSAASVGPAPVPLLAATVRRETTMTSPRFDRRRLLAECSAGLWTLLGPKGGAEEKPTGRVCRNHRQAVVPLSRQEIVADGLSDG